AGLRSAQPELNAPRGAFMQMASGTLLRTGSADTLHYVRIERHSQPGDTVVADSSQALRVRINVGGTHVIADLAEVAPGILARQRDGALPPELARVTVRDESGAGRGDLFILEIGL